MPKQDQQIDVRALRRKLKLNQAEFWHPIGVTQSGGSRYETGREMPEPVRILVNLVRRLKLPRARALLDKLRGEA